MQIQKDNVIPLWAFKAFAEIKFIDTIQETSTIVDHMNMISSSSSVLGKIGHSRQIKLISPEALDDLL